MSQKVAAVIPSYCPPPEPLLALVTSLQVQGLPVLVADDGSPCTADPALAAVAETGAVVARHRRNAGIARSLNAGLQFAASQGAPWLLTVDQDSVLAPDHVSRLLDAVNSAVGSLGTSAVGAVAASAIDDASGTLRYPVVHEGGVATTQEVIQTGTLWAVDPLLACGGFDESLGIDAVDAGACLALRAAGLRIVLAPDVRIAHRLGDGRQIRLLGRQVLASGHSPERRRTILRNRLRLFPAEFRQSPTHAIRTVRRVAIQTALAITVEEDRWGKAKGAARGLLPGQGR